MENYIILHGSFGSKDGNWFPWLKKELEFNNKNVSVPQFPVGVGNQNFESWSKEFEKLEINENTIIIAHSSAPVFVCKYLILNKIKVKKLVFVCGFNNYLGINEEYDTVNKPMYIDNVEDIKKYCSDITCFYSDNDPYVAFDAEKDFADTLTNRQYIIKNAGHINSESGYDKFYDILKILDLEKTRYAVRVIASKNDEILCIKYNNCNTDYLDFPGGKIEKDETEIEACKREFKEETGMNITDLEYVGEAQNIYDDRKYILKIYATDKVFGNLQNFKENNTLWMNKNEILEYKNKIPVMHLLDENIINYVENRNLNVVFNCTKNHEIINIKFN